jgi:adenine C2-methylase RlmN of 23S rRNA A2503 and tRNA A37
LIGDLSGVTEETDGSPSSSEIEVSDSTLKARMEGLVIHGGMDIESPELDSTTAEVFLCDSQDLSLGLSDDFVSDEWSETSGCIKYDANTSSGKGTDPPQQKRVTPSPNSLLDRSSFLTAIRDAGHTDVTSIHVDAFYGALHELGYPSMNRFSQKYRNSRAVSISKMRSRNRVPQKLLHFLQDSTNAFATLTTTIQSVKRSADSNVFRLYIKLHDHFVVETLAMMYDEGGKRYASISVSAQATSPIRLSSNYNLHASEMIEQIIHASRVLASSKRSEGPFSVRKLSFQGCGEPLLNYDNIVTTCLFVSERFTWNLNQGRITISTIGISPRIYDLTRDLPDVVIAIDLCAPTQEMRCSLLPLAQRYSLNDLLDALENHMQAKSFDSDATPTREVCCPRDKVMIRYIMGKFDRQGSWILSTSPDHVAVRDETSKLACAHELGKLCKNRRMSVNLVPYQRRSFHDEERCPSMRHIHAFMAVVKSYGVKCSVKLPMGASVVDESKQFAVHVESRNSSRGSCIRIKYSGRLQKSN